MSPDLLKILILTFSELNMIKKKKNTVLYRVVIYTD